MIRIEATNDVGELLTAHEALTIMLEVASEEDLDMRSDLIECRRGVRAQLEEHGIEV